MPMDAGDAVLSFFGDDSQLQATFDKVNAGAKAAIRPAGDEVVLLQTKVKALEDELAALALKLKTLEDAGPRPFQRMGTAAQQAKGEIALLGQEVGVTLPRYVRGFISTLPGVSEALSAAFEATAILFIIQAIVAVTEKLTEWVAETYIFTEAMKKSDALIAQSNATLAASAANVKRLKEEYSLLGLTGVAKTSEQIKILNVDMKANADALAFTESKLRLLTNSTSAFQAQNKEQIDAAQSQILILANQQKDFEQQKTNLEKQGAIERRAAKLIADNLALSDEKTFRTSIVDLALQETRLSLANQGKLDSQGSAAQVIAQNRLYQDNLDYLQRKRALLDEDATATLQQKKSADAAIENAERDHLAKLLKEQADITQGIRNLVLRNVTTPWEFADKDLQTSTLHMAISLENLDKVAEKSLKHQGDYLKIFATALANTGSKAKAYEAVLTGVYSQVLFAEEGAIQKAILGQESWGAALAEATKSELAAIAARSAVWAVYWLGRAIADSFWNPVAAGDEYTAAAILGGVAALATGLSYAIPKTGGSSASPGTPSGAGTPIDTSGAGTPQAPIVLNASFPHLSGGGLITRPTIIMAGEGKGRGTPKEIIVPLAEDDKSLDLIADRVSQRMAASGGGGGIHIYPQGHLIDLSQLTKMISKGVKKGTVRLSATDSGRVIKRG